MIKFPNSIFLSILPSNSGDRENGVYEEWSLAPVEGAENQEYIPALTWEDIAFICQTCTEVINSLPNKPCSYTPGFKDIYGEVLTRFNEQRKK